MFSSINSIYHWHTSHNCDLLTSEDRVLVQGTRGIRINYSRGPKNGRRSRHFTNDMTVKGLELEKPCETHKWNGHFPSESFQRENRTTFSEVPFIPEIFQWNEPKTCVPFTSQQEFPEFLGKWKTPNITCGAS